MTYGLPAGTRIGYGDPGFPRWVYQLAAAFGLRASTYPGHQETDRKEPGFAPNPHRLNRGIDWAGSIENMQRFADYLLSIRGRMEQVIWQNLKTGQRIGVAGGRDESSTGYYTEAFAITPKSRGHTDHVHTRQSQPIPVPVGEVSTPVRPQFTEIAMFGNGRGVRSRPPINFFIHTEEGDGSAKSLAEYCQGQNGVSYHYTLRDSIVYDVVDTDYYSWSVLSANVFSINLCFAGSRAGWSEAQWLQRDADIEIAAYLAVQDCRKYGIPITVIAPPYRRGAGISDHRYVTQQLGIGTHTDVGDNFPWGRFAAYVAKYAAPTPSGGFLMALSDAEQKELLDLARQQAKIRRPSRSPLDWPGSTYLDTCAGYALSADANAHVILVERLAVEYGDPQAIAQLVAVAAMDPAKFPDRQGHARLAIRILTKVSPESRKVGEDQIRQWLEAEAR